MSACRDLPLIKAKWFMPFSGFALRADTCLHDIAYIFSGETGPRAILYSRSSGSAAYLIPGNLNLRYLRRRQWVLWRAFRALWPYEGLCNPLRLVKILASEVVHREEAMGRSGKANRTVLCRVL